MPFNTWGPGLTGRSYVARLERETWIWGGGGGGAGEKCKNAGENKYNHQERVWSRLGNKESPMQLSHTHHFSQWNIIEDEYSSWNIM